MSENGSSGSSIGALEKQARFDFCKISISSEFLFSYRFFSVIEILPSFSEYETSKQFE